MKAKILIIAGLAFQIVFLFFVTVQATEPHDAIQVGLKRLKENVPSEAVTIADTTKTTWTIQTSGDFFYMADNWMQFIFKATICFTVISAVISACTLITLRNKGGAAGQRPTSNAS